MHLLFYDPLTPLAYDLSTLEGQGLGGTEATVLRVAQALKNQHQITIAQHCRKPSEDQNKEGICYLSFETAQHLKPDVLILLRQYRLVGPLAKLFPQARKFLWLHNMPSRGLYEQRQELSRHQFDIIAVSQFHRRAIEQRLQGNWFQQWLNKAASYPIHVLYNPIEEALKPDPTAWKPEQLFFMSSPQKGLPETLKIFEKLRRHFPEYQLLISNPGYNNSRFSLPPQARVLGTLTHHQVIQELRQSFCVFYPQWVCAETFGLVYAEANAVGTPVLAHTAGAASEVLSDPCQLVNGRQFSSILAKVREWREQRPVLVAREEFRLSSVKATWLKLLASAL